MRESKKKRLEKKGWRVGSASEFPDLSDEESKYIELKLKLSRAFKNKRQQKGLTQVEAARVLRSSQSRVAEMETGDPSVSVDLLIRAPQYGSDLQRIGPGCRFSDAFIKLVWQVFDDARKRQEMRG